MKKTLKITQSFGLMGILGSLGFTSLLLSSCVSSAKYDSEALKKAQEQAHAARAAYHQNQKARDYAYSTTNEPEVPPNDIRYYRVPVDAHVDEDGLLIEAHKLTLEIVQP